MERQFRDLWEPITGDQWGLSLAPSIVSPGQTASDTWGARFQQSLAARHRSDGRFVTDCDCGPPHKGRSDAPIDGSHFWTAPGLGSKPDPWATLWTDWWNPVEERHHCGKAETRASTRRDSGLSGSAFRSFVSNGGTGACLPSLSRSGARRWAPGELRRSVAGAFNEPRAEVAAEEEAARRWTQSRRHLYGPEYDAGAQMSALPWKRAPENARARARPRAFSAGPAKRGPVAHAAELPEGRAHGRHDEPFGSEPEACERRNSGSTGTRIE
ncbi:hypothetical protein IscW_ISCW017986 [Ixodes scapularis]|uniref:Uncharacterized protein n=1 Tax=Ixodes scapularis TaxID=6945 RepID=B7PFB0_IXOSC|nr:hypothetical protein IscW_ISCW017986 [Ixodes scapularis]|eukprot:XP_002433882.1 hypothetical protein IscW_ISCW017986 [Ixodes scapularis]